MLPYTKKMLVASLSLCLGWNYAEETKPAPVVKKVEEATQKTSEKGKEDIVNIRSEFSVYRYWESGCSLRRGQKRRFRVRSSEFSNGFLTLKEKIS